MNSTTLSPAKRARQGTSRPASTAVAAPVSAKKSVRVVAACTIRQPASVLYQFWRDLENLPTIVKAPVTIVASSTRESHWSVSAPPGDRRVEWDAVIITDRPDEIIAWQSRDGSEIANAGSVHFTAAPGDEGTEVLVELRYEPPGGKLGAWLAKLSGEEGAQQVAEALRRFKALMEAGEIPTTEGQSVGEPQRSKKKKDA